MPLKFWDEAFLTTVYLINRLPSQVINNETPFARLFGQELDYSLLHTFGYACWPNLHPYNSRKLQFHSKQCVFLGHSNLHKGFKCLDLAEGHIYTSRDVVFDEHVFPFASLCPNAGAWLKAEIHILPDILLNPTSSLGSANMFDHNTSSPLLANPTSPSGGDLLPAGTNTEQGALILVKNAIYIACVTQQEIARGSRVISLA
jgi:hypothetical protein